MAEQNLEASCIECKADLSKDPHKEDCPISLKQKADFAKIELEKKKKIDDEAAKKAIEDARKELEEKNKKEIARQANELKQKTAVLAKIRKLVPNEDFKDEDVLALELKQVFELYNSILKTAKDEKSNGKLEYDVTCPICNKFVGESSTYDGAVILQKEHKKKEHPSSGGNWLVLGLVFAIATAGAVAFYKMYKKSKKKGCSDCGEKR